MDEHFGWTRAWRAPAVLLGAVLLFGGHAQAQQSNDEAGPGVDLTPEGDTYPERTSNPGHADADSGSAGTVFSFSFNELDVNGNDIVTREEAQADPALREAFADVDQNGDLKISPTEFAAFEELRLLRERQGAGNGAPRSDEPQSDNAQSPGGAGSAPAGR